MARVGGYGEVNNSSQSVSDTPRGSLIDPHTWLREFHTFARTAGIVQPINLAEKTGATDSVPAHISFIHHCPTY